MIKSVCVFCGSSTGRSPLFGEIAAELGALIARRGLTLIYGGGNVGTMGILAEAAMREGGHVVGIIPIRLNEMVEHLELTELYVVDDMHERKAMMQDKADAFITLPGGIGTMEELFEVWAWRYIGYHSKPVGLVNAGGFYDDLLRMLEKMRDAGFMKKAMIDDLCVSDSPAGILDALAAKDDSGAAPELKHPERRGAV